MTLAVSTFRLGVLTRSFLNALSLPTVIFPTAIHLNLPSLFPGIFDSTLRAVPKKKQSHSRRRMRQLAGKALQDITALNKCPVCTGLKRENVLCEHCVGAIKEMWRKEQNSEDKAMSDGGA